MKKVMGIEIYEEIEKFFPDFDDADLFHDAEGFDLGYGWKSKIEEAAIEYLKTGRCSISLDDERGHEIYTTFMQENKEYLENEF